MVDVALEVGVAVAVQVSVDVPVGVMVSVGVAVAVLVGVLVHVGMAVSGGLGWNAVGVAGSKADTGWRSCDAGGDVGAAGRPQSRPYSAASASTCPRSSPAAPCATTIAVASEMAQASGAAMARKAAFHRQPQARGRRLRRPGPLARRMVPVDMGSL